MSPAPGDPRVVTKVFVRDLVVEAEIGVYSHELERRQALTIEVELDVDAHGWRALSDTVNYEAIVGHATAIAAGGHIGLVESFARRLADACLAEPRVSRARVRVEKPGALLPGTGVAGVEIIAERG